MAYRDEIARLEAMHAANPEGRVFAHLAEAYRKSGDFERAREVLEAGLQRHPQYASAHVVLGRVLMDMSEHEAADAAFRRVIELDPHNLVALRARADLAHQAGRQAEALRAYRELIALDPSDDEAVLRIAEIEARPAETSPAPAESATTADETGTAVMEEAALGYGEASLPAIGEEPAPAAGAEPAAGRPSEPFEAMDFGAVAIRPADAEPDAAHAEVDLGLGGLLEPTDLGGPRETPAVSRPEPRFEPPMEAESEPVPDAVLDLSGLGGDFTLPGGEAGGEDDFGLPGFDEIAADATPAAPLEPTAAPGAEAAMPAELPPLPPPPTAPAGEPAPAPAAEPAPSFAGEPASAALSAAREPTVPEPAHRPASATPVSETADFDALWQSYDDGAAAALPDIGPELITETIGDLYAQQGLHERAADVYARLLETRAGDAGLEAKLEAARSAASAAKPAVGIAGVMAAGAPAGTAKAGAFGATAEVGAPVTGSAPVAPPRAAPAAPAPPAPPESLAAAELVSDAEPEEPVLPDEPVATTGADAFDLPPLATGGDLPGFDLPLPADTTRHAAPAAPATPVGPAAEPEAIPLPPGGDLGLPPSEQPPAPGAAADVGAAAAAAGIPAWEAPAAFEAPTPPAADFGAETGLMPFDQPVEAEPPFVPMEDLGLEPVGGGDLAAPPAAESDEMERVESAWTGGAGAAAETASPFGWADPESPPEQGTIGDYLDSLLAWTPAPEAPAVEPTPTAAAGFDDIDELFGEPASPVPEPATPPSGPAAPARAPASASAPAPEPAATAALPAPSAEAGAPAAAGGDPFDDIDALFGAPAPAAPSPFAPPPPPDVSPTAQPAEPPPPTPAAPAPTPAVPAADAGWDPFAELAPEPAAPPTAPPPPTAAPEPTPAGGAFEWDPFAELTEAPAAEAPAAPAVTEAPAEPEPEADDDEDIDMFRAWLQSLKR